MKKLVALAIGTAIVLVIASTVVALRAQARAPEEAVTSAGTTASPQPGKPAEDTAAAVAAASDRPGSAGMLAMASAAAANKYLFIFFYKTDDEQTQKLRGVFEMTMSKISDRADSLAIDATDPAEKEIVDRLGVGRAPIPLALAIAPNGAVTRGLPKSFDEQRLLEAFASPGMEKCLKALQESKITLLCVQNGTTQLNEEAMAGVREFKADAQYGPTAEVVTVDPRDPAEAETLRKLNIDAATDQAITTLLAPPGKVIGTFKGATTKDMLVAATKTAAKGGCAPGSKCAPGSGCGPKKKGATGAPAAATAAPGDQTEPKNP